MKKHIRLGLLKETKDPVDNRVALTPDQCKFLTEKYPNLEIRVQSSDVRAFHDDEYSRLGIDVVEDVTDCDLLLGVKEVKRNTLIPGKHYIFFGHIAKMQDYNRPLCKALIENKITFTAWEYLTDDNDIRLLAFGRWAGLVGSYNALRLYGLKHGLFELPKPSLRSTLSEFEEDCRKILPLLKKRNLNIMITGNGRVAHGAKEFFESLGVAVTIPENCDSVRDHGFNVYQLPLDKLVCRKDFQNFSSESFHSDPSAFISNFTGYAKKCDILISAHFWSNDAPKYITKEMLPNLRADVIADISCDINGSIESTIRPSTHANPFYGINRVTCEETDYMIPSAIGVMAVDTCPNALPRDASEDFGNQIINYLIPELLEDSESAVLDRATSISNGVLTERFSYMSDFAYDN